MASTPELLKQAILQWRHETAIRKSNEGRVQMFGSGWIMTDEAVGKLVECFQQGGTWDVPMIMQITGWPESRLSEYSASLLRAISATLQPQQATSAPPLCSACRAVGHRRGSDACPLSAGEGSILQTNSALHTKVRIPTMDNAPVGDMLDCVRCGQRGHRTCACPTRNNTTQEPVVPHVTRPVPMFSPSVRKYIPYSPILSGNLPKTASKPPTTNVPPRTYTFMTALSNSNHVADNSYPRFEPLREYIFPPPAYPKFDYFADPPPK